MTGELMLRGELHPVDGSHEKVIAAWRSKTSELTIDRGQLSRLRRAA